MKSKPSRFKLGDRFLPQWLVWRNRHTVDRERDRVDLLRMAADNGILLHAEGGFGMTEPSVKWLLKRKLIRVERRDYGTGWARDLARPAPLRRSYGVITEAGRAMLAEYKLTDPNVGQFGEVALKRAR